MSSLWEKTIKCERFFLCLMSSPRGLCDRDCYRAPVKRGKMTGAISLLFSLWPFRMRVVYVSVCQRVRESKRERQTEKAGERQREPLGSNKSGLHWTGGSWRILRGKTGVHSILGQRLWSGASVISRNTYTETQAELKLPRDKTHFLLLYLITMSQPRASYSVPF